MFAATNLVIELGILILIFLGWQLQICLYRFRGFRHDERNEVKLRGINRLPRVPRYFFALFIGLDHMPSPVDEARIGG